MKKLVLFIFLSISVLLLNAQVVYNSVITDSIKVHDFQFIDWDKDSDQDIVFNGYNYSYNQGNSFIGWYENLGNNNFGSFKMISLETFTHINFNVLDIDADNDFDFIIDPESVYNDTTYVLRNDSGTLTKVPMTGGLDLGNMTLGYLDNDSLIDLAGRDSDTIKTYLNNGDGTFSLQLSLQSVSKRYTVLKIGDLDGDSIPDITYANGNEVCWIKNNGNGSYGNTDTIFTSATSIELLELEDLNKDSSLNLILGSSGNKLYTFDNNGIGVFTQQSVINDSVVDYFSNLLIDDFDNDGFKDVWARYDDLNGDTYFKIYVNDGSGAIDTSNIMSRTELVFALNEVSYDFDQDGDADVILSDWFLEQSLFYENQSPLPAVLNQIALSACDSVVFAGNTFYMDTVYSDTLVSATAAYDSIVVADIRVYSPIYTVDSIKACDSYTWIDGLTYTTSNNTAIYTLTGSNGCDSIISLELELGYQSTDSVFYQYNLGDTITFNGSNIIGDTNITVVHPTALGCDSTILNVFTFQQTVSLNAHESNERTEYKIYPNPFCDFISITGGLPTNENLSVSIYNMQGKLMMELPLNNMVNHTINLEHLDQGIYLLRINNLSYSIIKSR